MMYFISVFWGGKMNKEKKVNCCLEGFFLFFLLFLLLFLLYFFLSFFLLSFFFLLIFLFFSYSFNFFSHHEEIFGDFLEYLFNNGAIEAGLNIKG